MDAGQQIHLINHYVKWHIYSIYISEKAGNPRVIATKKPQTAV